MEVVGLIGNSGTGKSHRSLTLAKEMDIDAIIDDGLLISGNRILAGRSAKAEASRMAAVRRAIFQDESHAEEMRTALAQHKPKRLLILGTSEGMLQLIRETLLLPDFKQLVRIEDLASPEEMEMAMNLRADQGTHVIPVARSEVRRLIPVVLVDAFDILMRNSRIDSSKSNEHTIVKPHFSGGSDGLVLDLNMIKPLIDQAVKDSGSMYKLNSAQLKSGSIIQLDISSSGSGLDMRMLAMLQQRVGFRVSSATGSHVQQIDLRIDELLI